VPTQTTTIMARRRPTTVATLPFPLPTCSNASYASDCHHGVTMMTADSTRRLQWPLCHSHSQRAAAHMPATTTPKAATTKWQLQRSVYCSHSQCVWPRLPLPRDDGDCPPHCLHHQLERRHANSFLFYGTVTTTMSSLVALSVVVTA